MTIASALSRPPSSPKVSEKKLDSSPHWLGATLESSSSQSPSIGWGDEERPRRIAWPLYVTLSPSDDESTRESDPEEFDAELLEDELEAELDVSGERTVGRVESDSEPLESDTAGLGVGEDNTVCRDVYDIESLVEPLVELPVVEVGDDGLVVGVVPIESRNTSARTESLR